jgi:flagellar protein FliO/FliZ
MSSPRQNVCAGSVVGNSGSISQTLLLVVLFVAAMAALPWLVRRIQQRQTDSSIAAGTASKVLSAIAVGPHQRVVTVEVGPGNSRTVLVLGVTAQQISCLHVLPPQAAVPIAPGALATDFASEMQRQKTAPSSAVDDVTGVHHAQ